MKCAKTADKEIKTGVTMQCTTQSVEAQIPRLSAEKTEMREEVLINKVFPVKVEKHEAATLSALMQF